MEAANDWIYGMPDITEWRLQPATGIPNCGDMFDITKKNYLYVLITVSFQNMSYK